MWSSSVSVFHYAALAFLFSTVHLSCNNKAEKQEDKEDIEDEYRRNGQTLNRPE